MDGELGTHVRGEFEKGGLFKIRVPGNQLWVTTFKALGAAPIPINFGELYAALQTRMAYGQDSPLTLINSAKLYEVM